MKFIKYIFRISLYFVLILFFLSLSLFFLYQFGFLNNFSSVKFDSNKLDFSKSEIQVLDKFDSPISYDYARKNIEFEEINTKTIDAFLSIEDKDFYSHNGLNFKRMVKAMIKNLTKGKLSEGASTISQQVIKNTHLNNEKTFKRKFNEILLTKNLEDTLTKNEILTSYLNAIYFGNGAFGINCASQKFYSKAPKDLNLNESATLAGVIKSPKLYSPLNNEKNCIKRRNLVLNEMYKDGKITKEEYEETIIQPLNLNVNTAYLKENNYYRAVIDEACKILHLTERDLLLNKYKITTYMDENLQNTCENEIKDISKENENMDSAIIVVDNKTGGIMAYCGKSIYNLLLVKRPPGSTIKPIISYGPNIEYNLISPATKILDEKTSFEGYTPRNYNDKYHSYVSAKTALAQSYNVPSVKLLQNVGIDRAKNFANRMNIKFDKNDNGLSLAVGALTNGIDIKTLTGSYQAIANKGKFIEPKFIKNIKNEHDKVVYSSLENEHQVMKESTSYLLTHMMKEGVKSGTSKVLNIKNRYIAGKTGTVASVRNKEENTDCWSMSYTRDNTMCVWLGATGEKMLPKDIKGSTLPCHIAKDIYEKTNFGTKDFEMVDSVKEAYINEVEYSSNNKIMLAGDDTPDRYKIKCFFALDNMPSETSNMFSIIEPPILTVNKKDNTSVYLSFSAQKHLKYRLYREMEDDRKLIKEIANKNEIVMIEDNNLSPATFYNYYLEAEYLKDNQNISKQKSNIVKIYLTE